MEKNNFNSVVLTSVISIISFCKQVSWYKLRGDNCISCSLNQSQFLRASHTVRDHLKMPNVLEFKHTHFSCSIQLFHMVPK